MLVKAFFRYSKCSVVCLQETKLAFTPLSKFSSFCGFHLQEFRAVNAAGTKGGILTAWNSSLFEFVREWAGLFSLTVVLKRRIDGTIFSITNVYGPTCQSLRASFFEELRFIGTWYSGVWVVLGDFNVLLSSRDKNGPPSLPSGAVGFRTVVRDLDLIDLPLLNKAFTWSNGRRPPTLERLDRAFVSLDWHSLFPRSSLRALPRPRSDHSPVLLCASSFIPASQLFRLEAFWLRQPGFRDVVLSVWDTDVIGSQPVSSFSTKLVRVESALKSWSVSLSSLTKKQASLCLSWLEWLDRAEECRPLSIDEVLLRP